MNKISEIRRKEIKETLEQLENISARVEKHKNDIVGRRKASDIDMMEGYFLIPIFETILKESEEFLEMIRKRLEWVREYLK